LFLIFIDHAGILFVPLRFHSHIDLSGGIASELSKSLCPCLSHGGINNTVSFALGFLDGSLHLLHVVGNLLSIRHHFSFHVSVSLLQVLLEGLGGVAPDSAHLLDGGHVDVDGQLSGIEDAEEGDDG